MPLSRREFLSTSAAASSLLILPHRLRGQATPPNSRLQLAMIGVGGRGKGALAALQDQQIVAFCDVDYARGREGVAQERKTKGLLERFPDAKWFHDWRIMFEQISDQIDGVVITVPDHMHYAIGMEAIHRKKHVYIEKPLCRCITEVRALHAAAKKAGVLTQMGNQGRSAEGIRLAREWVQAGLLGNVHTVHAWTNHTHSLYSHEPYPDDLGATTGPEPIPSTLHYDLWLGVAPQRPYLRSRSHQAWRGHTDYGCGALGDWACHQLDAANFALDLGAPTSIEAAGSVQKKGTYPVSNTLTYRFPARGARPPVEVKWFDGGLFPPQPVDGFKFDNSGGSLFYGDKGILWVSSHSASARLLPEKWMREIQPSLPAKTIPRVVGGPHLEWCNAIREGRQCGSNFDYSAPLAETALLGVAAVKARARLEWDPVAMRFTNNAAANSLIGPGYAYRPGFGV
ncbi:MAG: Gfo/Idh/MocA family oxidoreductase [Verrucomicrobiota bacterium]